MPRSQGVSWSQADWCLCVTVSSWQASSDWSLSTGLINHLIFQVSNRPHHAIFRVCVEGTLLMPTPYTENYALVFLWAGVENHVGICAACAGALKVRWCATYKRVRTFSLDLKNKSWLASASTATSESLTRTQSTEDRTYYDRASSNASSLNDLPMDDKGPTVRMELVEMHPGARVSVLSTQQAKVVHIPLRHSRGASRD